MADDKFTDPTDESDESTPVESSDDTNATDDPTADQPAELSENAEIVDPEDTPDDEYVDDPSTPDINEAKLDRATDEVAEEETGDEGSVAQRRPRRTRPVRRSQSGAGERDGDSDVRTEEKSAADELEADSSTDEKAVARTDEDGRKGRPSRKDKATRTRRDAEKERAAAGSERTTPAAFVRESVTELRKVVWPTGTQVQQYFVVVLVFVLFIIAFVSLLDLGFGWLVLKAFG